MVKQRRFSGIVKAGKEADPPWFTFSVIGTILIFFFLLMGIMLWIQNILISIPFAILLSAAALVVSIFLHKTRVSGKKQTLLWILFIVILCFSGIVGNHYIYHHWNSQMSFRTSVQSSLTNRSALLTRFNSIYEDFQEIEDCDAGYLEERYEESKYALNQYQYKLRHLNNPIVLIRSIIDKDAESRFEELYEELSISLENYNALNTKDCHYTGSLLDDLEKVDPIANHSSELLASLKSIHFLYVVLIIMVCGLLLLVPYFVAKPAKTILKVRSQNN